MLLITLTVYNVSLLLSPRAQPGNILFPGRFYLNDLNIIFYSVTPPGIVPVLMNLVLMAVYPDSLCGDQTDRAAKIHPLSVISFGQIY